MVPLILEKEISGGAYWSMVLLTELFMLIIFLIIKSSLILMDSKFILNSILTIEK